MQRGRRLEARGWLARTHRLSWSGARRSAMSMNGTGLRNARARLKRQMRWRPSLAVLFATPWLGWRMRSRLSRWKRRRSDDLFGLGELGGHGTVLGIDRWE